MGVDTTRLRVVVVLCATLMTAGSVAISGMIGWVGLVIPHFGRMIFGQDYRRLLPASSLLGATFLMVVDNLARTITTSEIPLGILTSFVGALSSETCPSRRKKESFLQCWDRTAWEKARSSGACSGFWSRFPAKFWRKASRCPAIPGGSWQGKLPTFRSRTPRRLTIRC